MRSKIRCLTEFCNSHYLSHLAAFFIDSRAKISIVMSSIKLSPNFNLLTKSTKTVGIQHKQFHTTMILPQVHLRKPLLRLHLPLNDKIYTTSPRYSNVSENPKCSPDHSIVGATAVCTKGRDVINAS